MGSISTGIGLVSGIDSASLIDQLMQLERRPITVLQTRIAQSSQIQIAFTELGTRLNQLKSTATELRKPSTFEQSIASSSNEAALGAKADVAAAEGSYRFRVARLVSSQQVVTGGFATADETPIGAGSISIELGDSRLDREPMLEDLLGGKGIRRGVIEVVDRAGRIARIDLTDAVSLDDVITRFNGTSGASISAELDGNQIVLTDLSGGTGNFRVRDVTGNAAEDLGLLVNDAVGSKTGTDLAGLTLTTSLTRLNDGRGVANGVGDGLSVKLRSNATFSVDLSQANTVGDVIDQFNTAAAGKATLSLSGNRLVVTDTSYTGGATNRRLTIDNLAGSTSADDLGLVINQKANTATGRALTAGVNSTLLRSLNGGSGLTLGTIRITNATGTITNINLSPANDVLEVLDLINDANAGVEARLNDAGNGIDLVDTSNGTGDLIIADQSGTGALQLGLVGTFEGGTARGANLQRAWLNGNTKLDDLNAGRGISLGTVGITDSAGNVAEFNFKVGTYDTIQDVLNEFNRAGSGVSIAARINDNGDGILLEDTAGGTQALKISDVDGATAKDLRIAGDHVGGSANGSYEIALDVDALDSLEDIRAAINELGIPVRAEILNTGATGGPTPYRLSLSGRESGRLGGFVFDARLGDEGTALQTTSMSRARDAALFYGGQDSGSTILVTSGTNTITGVVPGLTLDLKQPTTDVVTIVVEQNLEAALEEVEAMVSAFNALRSMIDENTSYNQELNRRGPLLGEPAVPRIERDLYALVDRVYESGDPTYRILADVGISIADGAELEFDADKFRAAWADNADAVKRIFTQTQSGFGHQLQEIIVDVTDPADGRLTRINDTFTARNDDLQRQIETIEVRIEQKRGRLEKQFLDMELALSKLQFQQQQISAIPQFNFSSNNKNK